MEKYASEIKKIKRQNYLIFGLFVGLLLVVILAGITYQYRRSFSTSKWKNNPEERTKIVDDLLSDHELIGMQESDIIELLGENNNDYGYFNEPDRYVYYLGPERGFISIDSEWLILDFADGVVVDYDIKTD